MEKKYYSLGQISYSFLANDTYSFNKIIEWKDKVGHSALTFIDDINQMSNIKKIIGSSCNDWDLTLSEIHIYEPEPAMVIKGILEDKKFKTIYINIQKDIKQISFYITLCQDSWSFVTTYFIYKVPNASYYRPYNGEDFKCWSAFFCDMEFNDSLSTLVSDIVAWYDNQDVIKYNSDYY